MKLGTFPTRYDCWRPAPAIALLAALIAILVLAAWPVASSPDLQVRTSMTEQSDPDLYRAINRRVAAGEPYYPVTADELRKGGYPLKPFVTFRLPTLAVTLAAVPAIVAASAPAVLALVLLLGYGAMLAMFARADTFYWALLAAPLSLAGLVFVPRAIATLVRASRDMAQQTS